MGLSETRKDYARHSARVTRSKRWKSLRLEALRRDGFACVSCGVSGRLEVDHKIPVRTKPELAFDLDNLQSLCRRCHSAKTAKEINLANTSPKRLEWRELLKDQSLCLTL